ncbi:hypothetical protein L227DRAFT_617661 [Lentinus tigrinus ALCF2SS1-6]|uniref:DUF6534 domain-containing protein n=2 Tax=Lentinus tigrinus TaxID=5365 RepID=A0A5C2RR37_9APHY|nr:hypothetical protein L227DRAFT_617661 [Lentinus tigrinus ALCF2SS1-6]
MATATVVHPGPIDLNDTLGAAFLGHFVTTLLYGITSLQAFMYYRNKYNDPLLLKLSVLVLWILDTIHVALITGGMYWYCITNFTNLAAILHPIWPIPTMVFVSNLSNLIVRGIFAYRLYRLSHHSWILPGIIVVCSLFVAADGFYVAIKMYALQSYADISHISWGLYAGLSVEVAVDLIVAISQCVLLRGFETGIRSTDSAIRVLMTYSINTGLLTSLCAVGALVSYAVRPTRYIYFAFYFVLSKLYINSLLATLNARGSLLGKGRRHRHSKNVAFRTPTGTIEHGGDGAQGAGIEFTTVISADALSTDSIVEATKTKTKIDDEEAFPFPYRGSADV